VGTTPQHLHETQTTYAQLAAIHRRSMALTGTSTLFRQIRPVQEEPLDHSDSSTRPTQLIERRMKMNSQTRFVARKTIGKMIGLGVFSIQMLLILAPLTAQDRSQPINSEIRHIGNAQLRSVTKTSGFFPDRQPAVYWHDEDWKIDLLPLSSPDAAYELSITSSDSRERVVKLPEEYAQIDSISRTPNDKAIIIAEINGKTAAFGLVDLKLGKLIDNFAILAPFVSPNQRIILYVNTDYYDYYNYRLYDTSKTPRENTCGYRENDPEHKDIDEGYRGFPIYPRKANQTSCSDADDKAFNDESHVRSSDFVWSSDSSKAVFADVMNGSSISLIIVAMHHGDKEREYEGDHDRDNDLPLTLTYPFAGTENVCAGAATCDNNNVRSVAWNGDAVNVALVQANPTGPAIVKNLTIPLSKFIPLTK
jgi:hypothetical protein